VPTLFAQEAWMLLFLKRALTAVRQLLRSRRDLVLGNLAPRQQLEMLARNSRRPVLQPTDRRPWAWLSRQWPEWRRRAAIVRPDMLPVLRVTAAGRSEGKTLLASRLIEELTKRGYAVAAVKRSHHSVPPDRAGSDTDRFARAGASVVMFCGPDGSLIRTSAPAALGEVVRRLTGEADIAIVEGFKDDSLGAVIRLSGGPDGSAVFATMAGVTLLATAASDVEGLTAAIEREFRLGSRV
jgi:molybdopterin-guanine dinucleotide biosynthesis protein MobB